MAVVLYGDDVQSGALPKMDMRSPDSGHAELDY